MEEQKRGTESMLGIDIDFYSIVRDVLREWWVILILAISAALVCYVQVNKSYSPSYTIEATYVVTAKGINNSVYDNLTTAQDTATRFSQILNSPTLMNKVAEDLGMGGVPGIIQAEIIPETNLLTLRVTSGSPELAYRILRSVMDNYPTISEYLVGNAILDVLMAPVIPTRPDKALSIKGPVVRAFFLTVMALALVLAVLSYLRDTIRRSSDVEKKLDTRLIGTICHEEKNKKLTSKFRKNNAALLITSPVFSFRYVETVKKTSQKVLNRMEQRKAKTLLVTSYLENEGKSTVAANIALSLVQSGKKVALVDLDLRKPSQYKLFDLFEKNLEELGAVLNSEKAISQNLIYPLDSGLFAVFNTREYTHSTEMLTSGKLESLLTFLKEQFDYVIIDTPPMAHVADTEGVVHMVDASVIVVREHMARSRDINDMLDILTSGKADVIGCIFNDAHDRRGGAIFGDYGYGRGYGYGKYYGRYYGKYYGNYYGKKTDDSGITR